MMPALALKRPIAQQAPWPRPELEFRATIAVARGPQDIPIDLLDCQICFAEDIPAQLLDMNGACPTCSLRRRYQH